MQRGVDEHQRRVDCQGRRIRCIDAADERLLRVLGRGVQHRRDDGETFLLTVFVLPGEVGEAILNDAGGEQIPTFERTDAELQRGDDVDRPYGSACA